MNLTIVHKKVFCLKSRVPNVSVHEALGVQEFIFITPYQKKAYLKVGKQYDTRI